LKQNISNCVGSSVRIDVNRTVLKGITKAGAKLKMSYSFPLSLSLSLFFFFFFFFSLREKLGLQTKGQE